MHTGFSWGNVREGGDLKDSGADWWIILKWIFENLVGGYRLDRSGSG